MRGLFLTDIFWSVAISIIERTFSEWYFWVGISAQEDCIGFLGGGFVCVVGKGCYFKIIRFLCYIIAREYNWEFY